MLYDIGHPDVTLVTTDLTIQKYAVQPPSPAKILNKLTKLLTLMPLPILEMTSQHRYAAAAAKIDSIWDNQDVMTVAFSHQRYDFAIDVTIPISDSENFGLAVEQQHNKPMLRIVDCQKGTMAAQIPN